MKSVLIHFDDEDFEALTKIKKDLQSVSWAEFALYLADLEKKPTRPKHVFSLRIRDD
jgi:hypothetical protein